MSVRVFAACLLLLVVATAPLALADRAEGSFERTLAVTGPVRLEVATGSGNVTVRKGEGNSVRIQARIQANDRAGNAAALVREVEQNPPVQQTGNTIIIGSAVRKWNNVGISYDVTTPDQTQVKADSGSGNVECYDVRGPVEAGTGSGNVRVENSGGAVQARSGSGNVIVSRAGGSVSATSGSGSVQVTAVTGSAEATTGSGNVEVSRASGAVRARAGSGNVRVQGATENLDAESGSGGVIVDGTPKSARWNLRTGSGDVRVSLPPGTAFELDAHSPGSITTAHPVTVSGTVGKHQLRGVAIRPDNHIFIRTGSGSVRVD